MFNKELLADRLKDILEALERIPLRFETISLPDDFFVTKRDGNISIAFV